MGQSSVPIGNINEVLSDDAVDLSIESFIAKLPDNRREKLALKGNLKARAIYLKVRTQDCYEMMS